MAGTETDAALEPAAAERSQIGDALARAQELVDSAGAGRVDLPWYVEAMQVGDLSLLALLLRRPLPSPAETLVSREARRQLALEDWLREEGLSGADPAAVMQRMEELGRDDLESALRGHERRRLKPEVDVAAGG